MMATDANKAEYLTCCVNSDGPSIHAMVEAARDISFRTFAKNVDWQQWATMMGYSIGSEPGLHLKDDWHVSYHKSVYQGQPCYYARHSAIEYIFVKP